MSSDRRSPPVGRDGVDDWLFDAMDGIAIRVRQDGRARALRLRVDGCGVCLTLPLWCDVAQGKRFIAAKETWLRRQIERYNLADQAQTHHCDDAQRLLLRDAHVPVVWRHGGYGHLSYDAAGVVIQLPPRADSRLAQQLLHEFYAAQARIDIARWLPVYLGGLPRGPSRITLKRMRSLWGSLSPDATVALDLALILAPSAVFEYVLVHELCHLIAPNHSAAFWAEVTQRLPGWRHARSWLNRYGHRIKQELDGWLVAQERVRCGMQLRDANGPQRMEKTIRAGLAIDRDGTGERA